MKHTAASRWKTSVWHWPAWRRACSWLVFLIAVTVLMPPSAGRVAAQAPAAPMPIAVPAGGPAPEAPLPSIVDRREVRPDADKAETGVSRAINFSNPLELFRLGGPAMWPIACARW